MFEKHGYLTVAFCVCYSVMNYYAQRVHGQPIYWFVNWDKPSVFPVVGALYTVVYVFHYWLARVMREWKVKPSRYSE